MQAGAEEPTAPPTIAAGWDGRAGGFDALVLSRLLATALEADVQIVHVDTGEELERDQREDLSAAFDATGFEPQLTELAADSAADTLEKLAAKSAVDLLALGSTHRAGFGRVLPGATGERLLGRVPCPLAIAPRGFADRVATLDGGEYLRVIAVGFDGSPSASAALAFGARLAAAVHATIRVIAVDHPTPHDLLDAPAGHTAQEPVIPDLQDRLTEAVAELPDELRALGIFQRGDPINRVLALTEDGVDLLLIGSRSHSRVGSALVGGTARAIVRSAPCPVVVMPPPQRTRSRETPR